MTKYINILCIMLGAAMVLAAIPLPAEDEPARLIAAVQAAYRNQAGFKAAYLRLSRPAVLAQTGVTGAVNQAEGEIIFARPGNLRLIQAKPVPEEMIISPQGAWWFRPERQEAHRYPASEYYAAVSPLIGLFSGLGALKDEFAATRLAPADLKDGQPKAEALELKPLKGQMDLEKLVAWVDPKGLIVQLALYSLMGDETTYKFRNIHLLSESPEEGFGFTPPPGVKVVHH